jgi:hypothetical protein
VGKMEYFGFASLLNGYRIAQARIKTYMPLD